MAFENLFIRKAKSIGGIQMDAIVSEEHSNEYRKTSNPIELGADITDHVFIEPKTLSILAVVSDTPVGLAALGQIVDNVTGLFGTSNDANLTRSAAAYNSVIQLADLREPIEVQTKLVLYENMLITGVFTRQDKDTSRIASMTIRLEEALITESEIVQIPADQLGDAETIEKAASPETKGRQEALTPPAATNRSVLKTVTDFLGV